MNQDGRARLRRLTHVAVQIDPGDDQATDAERAGRYLQEYFREQSDMDLFWGDASDFARQAVEHIGDIAVVEDDDDDAEDDY